MSQEINPIHLQSELQERLKRYLMTALPINDRFPDIRQQAKDYLNRENVLVKGPYLEAIPDFEKGSSLKDLVEEGLLSPAFGNLDSAVYERPLHSHQDEAIRAILNNKNVVVATGTGSGKTECFLYPMIQKIIESDITEPGIRAIIIYPLNALANDQLEERLAPMITEQLKDTGLTIGRYTGHIKERETRSNVIQKLETKASIQGNFPNGIPDSWLLDRKEMRKNPPHILITNYSMLEHLLLLPLNRDLFNGVDLKFIILDELHSYQGTQATEVSMLLRKLRARFAKDKDIRCIGTSASLSSADGQAAKVAEFAGRLFQAKFELPIKGQRQLHPLLRGHNNELHSLSIEQWNQLHSIFQQVTRDGVDNKKSLEDWNTEVLGADIDLLVEAEFESLSRALCLGMAKLQEVHDLAKFLESHNGTCLLSELAQHIFKGNEPLTNKITAIQTIVTLGAYARETTSGYPLLPARYHIFSKGVDEATVELVPAEHRAQNLRFSKTFQDPETGQPRYRLLTCRKCGELYFEGFSQQNGTKIHAEPGRGLQRKVFWLKPKNSVVLNEEEDDAPENDDFEELVYSITNSVGYFNPTEGKYVQMQNDIPLGTEGQWFETWEAKMADRNDQDHLHNMTRMTKCYACGSRDPYEVVTHFQAGDNAMSAVISDTLYESLPLPLDSHRRESKPGNGRNLLAFSDNRQDAAFFAPSLQRSHEQQLLRWHVVKALKDATGRPLSLVDLATDLSQNDELIRGLTDETGKAVNQNNAEKHIAGLLLSEFCTPGGTRSGLEDLGLVEVSYSTDFQQLCTDAELPDAIGADLLRHIFDVIRTNRAISTYPGLNFNNEFYWGHYSGNKRYYKLSDDSSPRHRFTLLPSQTQNGHRRNGFVHLLLDRLGQSNWLILLADAWSALTQNRNSNLISIPGKPHHWVLNHESIRLSLPAVETPVYQCSECGTIDRWVLQTKSVCRKWNCKGMMEQIPVEKWKARLTDLHYHYNYTQEQPIPTLIAKEHTAALSVPLKEEYETGFREGSINILSCSTTMEMGIDLGDLYGVLLRNVPPGISNYQQRAGRAGRRGQGAPVSLTYARNRQYDQVTYNDADNFLKSPPPTPVVHLTNIRLLRRHQFSILLSGYLEHLFAGEHQPGLQIGQLFGLGRVRTDRENGFHMEDAFQHFGEDRATAVIEDIYEWLNSEQGDKALNLTEQLSASVAKSLPENQQARVGYDKEQLKSLFHSEMASLTNEFSGKYSHFCEKMNDAINQQQFSRIAQYQRQALRIANQQLIEYLSKHGIIPNYAFPVDTIELEVIDENWNNFNDSSSVELTRDARYGIVEYAPGAEVIANGRRWISRGIVQNTKEFNPTYFYKICQHCNHIEYDLEKSELPSVCRACQTSLISTKVSRFIEPKSFITSATESKGLEPGKTRPKPPAALEQILMTKTDQSLFSTTDLSTVNWAYQDAKKGRMVIINKGRDHGFIRCGCSYSIMKQRANSILPATHENPRTGQKCEGQAQYSKQINLAHTFYTDVLQIQVGQSIDHYLKNSEYCDLEKQDDEIKDKVARTLAEAIRLAAITLLSIPEGEISASFRWLDNYNIEFVLSDSVSGGAGYVDQLRDFGAQKLLRKAKHLLDCPQQCTHGCASCLQCYSNQYHWDTFRRLPTKGMVESILEHESKDVLQAQGAKALSSKEFMEMADQATRIVWFCRDLSYLTNPIPSSNENSTIEPALRDFIPGVRALEKWLGQGKQIDILSENTLINFQDPNMSTVVRFEEAFLEKTRTGKLKIGKAPRNHSLPLLLLRMPDKEGWTCIHTQTTRPDIFAFTQLPEPAKSLQSNDEKWDTFLKEVNWLKSSELRIEDNRLKRFELNVGRNTQDALKPILDLTKNLQIHRIKIRDRYAMKSDVNMQLAFEFLKAYGLHAEANNLNAPAEIVMNVGPVDRSASSSEQIARLQKLKKLLRQVKFIQQNEVNFRWDQPVSRNGDDTHDRKMYFENDQGVCVMKLELTGGMDILMHQSQTTRVFAIIENS